jgi:predicted ABC-type ATPase
MTIEVPRLRMFAGPNGSGKSTLKTIIRPELLGVYINPDEIEKTLKTSGTIDLNTYQIKGNKEEFIKLLSGSDLFNNNIKNIKQLSVDNNLICIDRDKSNSYIASVIADFIRKKLLNDLTSFTFETVMSFPDKIDLLALAKSKGYRTYLYYVATEDPSINISRVHYRVSTGGHPVSEDKIISRYHRSLSLLINAIKVSNRAYIFDNSGPKQIWLAEITDGHILEVKTDKIPAWFSRYVWDNLKQT